MSVLITSQYSPRSSTGVCFCTCTRLLVWKSAVTSAKRRLFAADDHFKTLMKFLPLVWSPSARLVRLHAAFSFFFLLSFPTIPPDLFPFAFSFLFFGLLVVMFFCLKAGTTKAKQYAMFECVLTPRLHKA